MSMALRMHYKQAIRQLSGAKLRSFLALLGVLIGTASVVALVSIGKLSERQIMLQFQKLGLNLITVSMYNTNYQDSKNADPGAKLSLEEAQNLPSASGNIRYSAPYYPSWDSIYFHSHRINGSLVGVNPGIYPIAKLKLEKGRMLSFLDQQQFYGVIGAQMAQQLQKIDHRSVIGKQIRVGKIYITIVGILKKWPSNYFFNTDFNNAILMPIETVMAMHKNPQIQNLAITLYHKEQLQSSQDAIEAYLKKHTLRQNISFRSPKTLIDSAKKSTQTMNILLAMIGSISLLVGGIGVMNIMLVSVSERHQEIGIRLAIGARKKDIQLQFLIEAVCLSLLGGIIGMVIGVVITYIVAWHFKWSFMLYLLPIILGVGVAVILGIFFGFYPAKLASNLDPIKTLRSD